MAGVFDSYEHQFSTITSDITARIGKIPNTVGSQLPIQNNCAYFVTHLYCLQLKKRQL